MIPKEPTSKNSDNAESLPSISLTEIESHLALMESWSCPGCGIPLQYRTPSDLGFVPLRALQNVTESNESIFFQLRKVRCERCYQMEVHGKLKVQRQFSYETFGKLLKDELSSNSNVLLLQLVDILDIPGSLLSTAHRAFGTDRQVMLIVNKGDLIPLKSGTRRLMRHIQQQAKSAGIQNIQAIYLVSALKGIGMHEILRDIKKFRKNRDLCVIGAANVGKSTFLNSFLSYLVTQKWKHNHRKYMKLPEVTLSDIEDENAVSMLNMDHSHAYASTESVETSESSNLQTKNQLELLREELAEKYHVEPGDDPVTLEIATEHEERKLTTSPLPGTTLAVQYIPVVANNKLFNIIDTPGLIEDTKRQQLVEVLATDASNALRNVFPTKTLPATIYRLKPNQSLFLGALARFDYISPGENRDQLLFCWHGVLPGHVTKTANAEAMFIKHAGKILSPPRGLNALSFTGPLKDAQTITLSDYVTESQSQKSKRPQRSSLVELVLPGFGWCSVTAVDFDGTQAAARTLSRAKVRIAECLGLQILPRPPLFPFEVSSSTRDMWKR
uniref:Uncharacterized protein AlNc14C229G9274 n=1 Tax=Albugo laibachii Nc14 TaxID=890382 RepID=F0WSD4_9STRA|nr:conserved hypothetical protein [Albugo laibachii Nc14]|eukprot:CCA24254.1 conserved hypothetical protein [Albugo laibachii Nc14]